MIAIDDILNIGSSAGFEEAALELFAFQAANCKPYDKYISLIGLEPSHIKSVSQIPFLPIELFKTQRVYSDPGEAEIVFTSSGTGESGHSSHYMAREEDYRKTFLAAYEYFYGPVADRRIYALLPGYLERTGSSLIYMIDKMIELAGGGFYLNDFEGLIKDMESYSGPKLLFGVSHALWDLAEQYPRRLSDTIIMETGGMKGRREEIPKDDLHGIFKRSFGVDSIHSEYGMAELTSQAYSIGGNVFKTPPWMKVMARELNDPFEILTLGRGGINIIDLANIGSCAFIQTQDLGVVYPGGEFSIIGRMDRSEVRGCNLLLG